MNPDSMLVEPEMIWNASDTIAGQTGRTALEELRQREPALAGWLEHQALVISGKMAISGAPKKVVMASHHDFVTIALVLIEAMRIGHYKLWHDSIEGTPLADLEEDNVEPERREG
jgi:hypothetical protein